MIIRLLKMVLFVMTILSAPFVGIAKEEGETGAMKPEWIAYQNACLGESPFDAWIKKARILQFPLPVKTIQELEHYYNHPDDKKTNKWAAKILEKTKRPDAQWVFAAYIVGQNESPPMEIKQVIEPYGYSRFIKESTGCFKYDKDIRLLVLNTPNILESTYPRISLPKKDIEYLKKLLMGALGDQEIAELGARLRSNIDNLPFSSSDENAAFFIKIAGYLNATGDSQFLSDLWSHPGEYQRRLTLDIGAYASDGLLVQTLLGHLQDWHKEYPKEFFKAGSSIAFFINEQVDRPEYSRGSGKMAASLW